MAGKKKETDSTPANATSQDFFQQAVDATEGDDPGQDSTGSNQDLPGIEPEFDTDHPYFREPEPDSSDDDSAGEEPAGDSPDPAAIPDKENPDRYQYWQSIATKQQQKIDQLLDAMQNRGSDPKAAEPEKTPEQVLSERQSELEKTVIAERPKKPEAYNAQDAYTDPDSASFQYRKAMDEWNENYVDTMQKRENLRSEIYDLKLKMVEEPVKKISNKTQVSEANQQTVDFLKEKHNFSDEEAIDFVKVMSRPESMSMDNLVKFYRHQRGVKSPADDNKSTNRDNRSRKREAAPPIPLGSGAGSSQTNDDDAELGIEFGRSLLSFNR